MSNTITIPKVKISGGKLSNNFVAYIDLTLDFEGCTLEMLKAALTASSSYRVQFQSMCANRRTEAQVKDLALKGYTWIVRNHIPGLPAAPMSAGDLLMLMSKDDFVAWMIENIPGVDADAAVKVYNRKHNIQ